MHAKQAAHQQHAERADHDDLAVPEADDVQDPENEGQAEGDQRIPKTHRHPADELLK
jgi:hypothetical protein